MRTSAAATITPIPCVRKPQYTDELRTLPVTYLCPRHAGLFDIHRPGLIHWPMIADDLTPENIIGG